MILGAVVSSSAAATTASSEPIATNWLRLVRNSEIATIGNSSPTAPAARMYRPNRPWSISLSCRIGSSVPSAVVVRARPIGTKSRTRCRWARVPTAPTASSALTAQPIMASRPDRSRNCLGSSS